MLMFRFMSRSTRFINGNWRSSENRYMQRWQEPVLGSWLILDELSVTYDIWYPKYFIEDDLRPLYSNKYHYLYISCFCREVFEGERWWWFSPVVHHATDSDIHTRNCSLNEYFRSQLIVFWHVASFKLMEVCITFFWWFKIFYARILGRGHPSRVVDEYHSQLLIYDRPHNPYPSELVDSPGMD